MGAILLSVTPIQGMAMPIQAMVMAMAVLITALIGAMADALAAELIGDGIAGIKPRGYRSRLASFATLRAMRHFTPIARGWRRFIP